MSGSKSVLLVEDHAGVRHSITCLLQASGVAVTPVASASEALTEIRQSRFDVVCMDFGLPDMDGAQLISALRDRGIETPILLISGAPRWKLNNALQGKPQPERIMLKPVAFAELLALIDKLADRQEHSRPATRVA